MDKGMIIDAYNRGLISREECTKLLGVDPSILIGDNFPNIHQQRANPYSN